ncbi:conserved hypothetical protein [Trichinella spiralis]|uniref:hypothetical protein n=1 Tax=Trichinella spiralis TaxID=6334 RepID=UPI0001EFE832|nr:conserved hypothetical protein [Trichinella spiralis]
MGFSIKRKAAARVIKYIYAYKNAAHACCRIACACVSVCLASFEKAQKMEISIVCTCVCVFRSVLMSEQVGKEIGQLDILYIYYVYWMLMKTGRSAAEAATTSRTTTEIDR